MNLASYLSLMRGFLCLLFLSESPVLRTLAILLAAVTDFLDGYIARRFNMITPLGTKLDPLMDKVFVACVLFVFWIEDRLSVLELTIFLLRDISLLLFVSYLWIKRQYHSWEIRSFTSGKLMTTFQFIALIVLALGGQVPFMLWAALAVCGGASFFELVWLSRHKARVERIF